MQQPVISLEITDRPSRRHQAVARALSFLIEATPREAMFGLFGHWGRGKSFIANLIGLQLTKSHHIVWFSAWRYPNVPECWAFLFQCIMKAIGDTGLGGRVSTLIRYNLRKHGMSNVLLLHLLVFFAIIGSYHQLLSATWLISILGLSLSLIVLRIIWGARGKLGAIVNTLVMPPSHREKLGLQEVLGDDLRMLINAWTGADAINMPRGRLFFALLLLSAVLPAIDIASSQSTLLSWAHTAGGEVWIAWSVVLLLFVTLALYWPKTKSRVLLVLDDLDRCTTQVAQKLIESVALLLDEKSKNGQIHVLALIDDSVLLRAPEFQNVSRSELRLGYIDRLFAAHVTLPPLESFEFEQISSLFFRQEELNTAKASRNQAVVSDESKKKRGPAIEKEIVNIRDEITQGPKNPAPYKIKRRGERLYSPRRSWMMDGPFVHEYEYEETVTPPPLSEQQKRQWKAQMEARIRSLESELETLPSLMVEAGAARVQAEENYVRLLIEMDSFDESPQNRETKVKVSTEFTKEERACLISMINDLPVATKARWGPRSAQSVFKKYLLLKMLWTELGYDFELSGRGRTDLIYALRCAIQNSLNVSTTLNDTGHVADKVEKEMYRLAQYVV